MALQLTKGTEIVFGSEVGDDVAWTNESVANDAGRQSASYDRTASAQSPFYMFRGFTQAQATPSVGAPLEMYLKLSEDNTHWDNDDGAGDIALSAELKIYNLYPLGGIACDEAAANIEFGRSFGMHLILERYVAVVMLNKMNATITADGAETKVIMTPVSIADA